MARQPLRAGVSATTPVATNKTMDSHSPRATPRARRIKSLVVV